ncbi:MAG: ribosome maturation factor RimM [Acidobacteriota bacterium]|nr:ribosome maturation factor RimM [Acidobacteriota bacterium]
MSSKSSRTEERSDLPETVAVGRVLRPHGLRGELVVQVLSDVPDRLDPGSVLLLTRQEKLLARLTVASRRAHRSGALVRFEGCDSRDQADELRGAWLEVERARVPEPPAGTYYHYQLVGCRCRDGEAELGRVVDLLEDGGGLLLIVSDGQREVPVPFVGRFLRRVDVERGQIDLDLPPGLLEVCASGS